MVEMPEKADEICRAVFKRLKERLPPSRIGLPPFTTWCGGWGGWDYEGNVMRVVRREMEEKQGDESVSCDILIR